jgi:ATP-dependent Clp protease ATP-binding subunit ClpA
MFAQLRTRLAAMKTIKGLLEAAERSAAERGDGRPSAEHLVLAALELPDGAASETFERLGRSPGDFAAALDAQEADDLRQVGIEAPLDAIRAQLPAPGPPAGVYHSEPSAQQLFRIAGEDARRHGGTLTGAHVLRAAADLEHGVVARTLRRLGIDREELRAAATVAIERLRAG